MKRELPSGNAMLSLRLEIVLPVAAPSLTSSSLTSVQELGFVTMIRLTNHGTIGVAAHLCNKMRWASSVLSSLECTYCWLSERK